MEKRIFATTILLLAGLIWTGCNKIVLQKQNSQPGKPVVQTKTSSPGPATNSLGGGAETNMISRNLGELTLTNHYETCVPLGAGQDCLVTPKILDGHNVQLTLAVESKTPKGKIHDLSITQVVTRSGKPFEVAVGEFNFSLTPNVTSE